MKIEADLGKVGITVAGEWSVSEQYERLTIVSRSGSSYLSKRTNKGKAPESNPDDWMLVAAKGSDGQDSGGSGGGGGTISIGVDFGQDGYLYWVVNGVWLLDPNGNKVRAQGIDGSGGGSSSGDLAFKSIVFLRSNTTPSTPSGGTFENPVPTGWSDGIPTGEAKLWMSTRWFYSDDAKTALTEWSTPSQATDTADVDFEFSSVAEPGTPTSNATNWHNEAVTGDVWMAVRIKRNGVWGPWSIAKIKGENGVSPNAAFKSIVFKRSNSSVSAPSSSSGSYASPVPVSEGWSDGIPSGQAKLWMSTRIFSSDGQSPQQSSWTTPVIVADNEYMDYEFSSVASPGTPNKATPASQETNPNWSNTATESTIWMAMRKISNGSYSGSWQIVKIKGENGKDGTSVTIKGKLTDPSQLPSTGNVAGDGYLIDGNLYVWDGDSWENVGKIKGEDGDDGRTPYIHIKYSNDGGETFTDNDGEDPGDYIGIYVDYTSEDSDDVEDYSWKDWRGEDGFGYEYIFKATSSASAPNVPDDNVDEDDYVPTGWYDNIQDVSAATPYQWVCWRTKVDGVWGDFQGNSNGKAKLFSHFGKDGETPPPGRGISSVVHHYLAINTAIDVTRSTSGWTTSIQTIGPDKKYLWKYETTNYTDNTSVDTDPIIIGVYGVGEAGRGITSVSEKYGKSESRTEQPTRWYDVAPELDSTYKWLWNYEIIHYDDDTTTQTDPQPLYKYVEGRGIGTITEYYLVANDSSGITTSDSRWRDTMQVPTENARYLWNYERITFTDDSTPFESEPVIIGVYVIPAYADDVEFLKGLFGDEHVWEDSGAVLGSIIGVKDGSNHVVAMLNAESEFEDSDHGKILIAAGLPNGLYTYENATFQVYEDGHVVLHDVVGVDVDMTGHIVATSGRIGPLAIGNNGTLYWEGQTGNYDYLFQLSNNGMGVWVTDPQDDDATIGAFEVANYLWYSHGYVCSISTQTDGVTPLVVTGNQGEDAILVSAGNVTLADGDLTLQHGSLDVFGDITLGIAGRIKNFRLSTGIFGENSGSQMIECDSYPSYQNWIIFRTTDYSIEMPRSPKNGDEYNFICLQKAPIHILLNGKRAWITGDGTSIGSEATLYIDGMGLQGSRRYKAIFCETGNEWIFTT